MAGGGGVQGLWRGTGCVRRLWGWQAAASRERWVLRGTGAVGGLGGIECFQLSATLRCGVPACFGAWGSSPSDPLSSDQNKPRGAAGVGCRLRTANRGWGAAAWLSFTFGQEKLGCRTRESEITFPAVSASCLFDSLVCLLSSLVRSWKKDKTRVLLGWAAAAVAPRWPCGCPAWAAAPLSERAPRRLHGSSASSGETHGGDRAVIHLIPSVRLPLAEVVATLGCSSPRFRCQLRACSRPSLSRLEAVREPRRAAAPRHR